MDHFLLADLLQRLEMASTIKSTLRKFDGERQRYAHVVTVSAELEVLCRRMGLVSVAEEARGIRESTELQKKIKSAQRDFGMWKFTLDDAAEWLTRLGEELRAKLSTMFAVPIAPERNKFLGPEDDSVVKAFPTAAAYLSGASACISVQLWQASVYHSMLSLEVLLAVLARRFKIATTNQQWNTVIAQIEGRIGALGPANGRRWREHREHYSDLALEFRFVKDAWRNRCMHLRTTYNESAAVRILEHCRAIGLEMAASGLREKPRVRGAKAAATTP